MFFSKIWFFIVAIAAGVAITIALVMPRPAERATNAQERLRLQRACSVTDILMRDNARARIQLAGEFARASDLAPIAAEAAKGDLVSGEQNGKAKRVIADLLKDTEGTKPDFVVLLDGRGRVVSRTGIEDNVYGDSLAGYFIVDEALAGYVRDDLWYLDGKLYRIAASPVLSANLDWAGAVVLGHSIDKDFAKSLGDSLQVSISFYMGDSSVASNNPVQVHSDVLALIETQRKAEKKLSCSEREPQTVRAGNTEYSAMLSELPGEAGLQGAFYAVFIERPQAMGFSGTFSQVRKDDLSFSEFPWIKLAVLFVFIVGIGLGLMIWETDLPLRRLNAEAVELAKGDGAKDETRERLNEDHRGKFGSIARAVNIVVDKLSRDARAAKKDLDQLMGPAPASSTGATAAAPAALPGMDILAATPAPPPPSQFQFSGKPSARPAGPPPKTPPPTAGGPAANLAGGDTDFDLGIPKPPPSSGGLDLSGHTPPPAIGLPGKPPPPLPKAGAGSPVVQRVVDAVSGPVRLPKDGQATIAEAPSDDLLAAAGKDSATYQSIFEDFVALKKKCGESIESLTYEKFAKKLERNRDALIEKHGCKSVKFQVYIKDGKAALKASPEK